MTTLISPPHQESSIVHRGCQFRDLFPGAFLVDVFPAMLNIPELLAPFKQTARVWARATKNMVEAPYLFVRRQMVCRGIFATRTG
jgi:hypothetical protein